MSEIIKDYRVRIPVIWLVNLLLTIGVIFISTSFVPHGSHIETSMSGQWFQGMLAWDGNWYLSIAKNGYKTLQSTAFFPLYPLLVRIIVEITGMSYGASAVLISNISYLGALFVLYHFTTHIWCEEVGKQTLLIAMVFPGTVFFTMAYTESLTLMLTVFFFLLLSKDKWYACVAVAFTATSLKQLGLVLAVVLLVYLIRNREQYLVKRLVVRVLSLGLIPLSLLMYMVYTYWYLGDFFAFLHAQAYWQREAVIPYVNILLSLAKLAVKRYEMEIIVMRLVNGLTPLLFTYIIYRFLKDKERLPLKLEMSIYLVMTLLMSITSAPGGGTEPFGRHMSTLFVVYPLLYIYFGRQRWFWPVCLLLYCWKILLVGMFCNGYWVT